MSPAPSCWRVRPGAPGGGSRPPETPREATTFSPDALRQIRRERRVTQRKLADAIGRDFTTVSQYETGRCAPSLDALATIAEALGAPVTAFIKAAA